MIYFRHSERRQNGGPMKKAINNKLRTITGGGRLGSVIATVILLAGCADDASTAVSTKSMPLTESTSAVISVAKRDAASFLNRIPVGREAAYGFKNREEFARVRTAEPLRVHTIDVAQNGGETVVSDDIRALDQWRVPLMVDGERRALLTVVQTDEGLKTVDFGGAGLADSLDALDEVTSQENTKSRFLLRVVPLRQDFLGIPDASNGDRFYPASNILQSSSSRRSSGTSPALSSEKIRALDKSEIIEWTKASAAGGAK